MFYDTFSEFDRLFNDAFSSRFRTPVVSTAEVSYAPGERQGPFRPRMDLFEAQEGNLVTATFELPGLTSEDVAIDVQENRLTISGNAGVRAHGTQEEGYAVRERQLGKFSRTLQLPVGTRAGDVNAKMENGLLTVTFPKVSPEQQPHRISIQTA
ncbi:HSP20-like chaperone [Tylopilus felleus]